MSAKGDSANGLSPLHFSIFLRYEAPFPKQEHAHGHLNPVQPKINMFPSTAPAMIGTAGRTFLVLNLRLHIVDGIRGFHVLTPGIEVPSLQETVECHRKVYEN